MPTESFEQLVDPLGEIGVAGVKNAEVWQRRRALRDSQTDAVADNLGLVAAGLLGDTPEAGFQIVW
jgi:hypothetical protein